VWQDECSCPRPLLSSGALAIHLGFSLFLVSTFPCGGPERGRRDWSPVGTLLGPEEAGVCPGLQLQAVAVPPRVRGGGRGAVRILRTAQWTRASNYLELFPFGEEFSA
jgi:hypothetical protein